MCRILKSSKIGMKNATEKKQSLNRVNQDQICIPDVKLGNG